MTYLAVSEARLYVVLTWVLSDGVTPVI